MDATTALLERNTSDRFSLRSASSSNSSAGLSITRLTNNNHEMVLNPTELLDQVLVQCPNTTYCHQILPRSQLPSHIMEWCHSLSIQCPHYGCQFAAPRSQLFIHKLVCQYRNSSTLTSEYPSPTDALSAAPITKSDIPSSISSTASSTASSYSNSSSSTTSMPVLNTHFHNCNQSFSISNEHDKPRIKDGAITPIELDFNINENLGILVVGGCETSLQHIYIQSIVPGSVADRDGRLKPGDQILEVNHCDITQKTHDNSVDTILNHKISAYSITLTILRDNNRMNTKIISVQLQKKESEILGLKMGGLQNQSGVYIHEIIKGSQAFTNGGFKCLDRVLQVNNVNLLEFNHEKVTQIINNLNGRINIIVARKEKSDTDYILNDYTDMDWDLPQQGSPSHSSKNFYWKKDRNHRDWYSQGQQDNNNYFSFDNHLMNDNYVFTKEKLISVNKLAGQQLGLTISGGMEFNTISDADTPVYVANIAEDNCLHTYTTYTPTPNPAVSSIGIGNTDHDLDIDTQLQYHTVTKGDILLSVNNVDLLGIRHADAVSALKNECEKCEKIDIRIFKSSEYSSINQSCDFIPRWSFWFNLPSYYQFPKIVILTKDSVTSPIGFSIVGGIDSFQMPISKNSSPNRTLLQIISRNKPSDHQLLHQVMIRSILPGSAAAKSNRLRCGDILLSVDEMAVSNLSHTGIVALLKRKCSIVKLRIIRWPGSEL